MAVPLAMLAMENIMAAQQKQFGAHFFLSPEQYGDRADSTAKCGVHASCGPRSLRSGRLSGPDASADRELALAFSGADTPVCALTTYLLAKSTHPKSDQPFHETPIPARRYLAGFAAQYFGESGRQLPGRLIATVTDSRLQLIYCNERRSQFSNRHKIAHPTKIGSIHDVPASLATALFSRLSKPSANGLNPFKINRVQF